MGIPIALAPQITKNFISSFDGILKNLTPLYIIYNVQIGKNIKIGHNIGNMLVKIENRTNVDKDIIRYSLPNFSSKFFTTSLVSNQLITIGILKYAKKKATKETTA